MPANEDQPERGSGPPDERYISFLFSLLEGNHKRPQMRTNQKEVHALPINAISLFYSVY